MIRLQDMSWVAAREMIQRTNVALFPIGAIENHGPHLPLSTDFIPACRIAEEASNRGGWPVLPSLAVGDSQHHRQFWGTLWVSPETLTAYVRSVVRSLATHGIRRVVFVNGHGNNSAALDRVTRTVRDEGIFTYLFHWWDAIPELVESSCSLPHDHAGETETSMVLESHPELVDKARYAEAWTDKVVSWGKSVHGVSVALDTIDFTAKGVLGDPSEATAEKGRMFVNAAADELDAFCHWLSSQPEESLMPTAHLP